MEFSLNFLMYSQTVNSKFGLRGLGLGIRKEDAKIEIA